ncbi:MAG: YigZ family protein [Anaerolineae bacterium]
MNGYPVPAQTIRVETRVANSRFITTVGPAETVDKARAFISAIRRELPDATHHVYAFKIGYGSSVIEGMSDDGEPAGTAGPPVLSVLRGADLGDVVMVVTRYFGGTKLGTGGLVRAYGSAAQTALEALPRARKVLEHTIGLEFPYPYYERIQQLLEKHEARVREQEFSTDITLYATIPVDRLDKFTAEIQELTAGQVSPILLDEQE